MDDHEPAAVDKPSAAAHAGIEVVIVTDPEAAAPAIALDRGAELVADTEAAAAAVTARRTAPRAPIDDERIDELRRLAGALSQAQRIRTHTEVGFRDVMVQRMARSSGIAVHPTSIRDAAETIQQAERDLVAADAAIEAHIASTMPTRSTATSRIDGPLEHDEHPPMFDEPTLEARRASFAGVGLVVSSVGIGLILAALGVAIPVAVGIALVGVVVSIVLATRLSRSLRAHSTSTPLDDEPLSDLLPDVDLDLGAAPEGTPPTPPALQLDHNRAEARLRSATRHWETLVGPSADPHDLEAVVRAHDPQVDLLAAGAISPTVRTVSAVYRRAAARWRAAWAALGYPEAPAVDRVDQEIDRLVAGIRPPAGVRRAGALASGRPPRHPAPRAPQHLHRHDRAAHDLTSPCGRGTAS